MKTIILSGIALTLLSLCAMRQDDGKDFAACQKLHSNDYCLSYLNP